MSEPDQAGATMSARSLFDELDQATRRSDRLTVYLKTLGSLTAGLVIAVILLGTLVVREEPDNGGITCKEGVVVVVSEREQDDEHEIGLEIGTCHGLDGPTLTALAEALTGNQSTPPTTQASDTEDGENGEDGEDAKKSRQAESNG